MEPLARRGDPDALALLEAPYSPPGAAHLYELYAEFTLWCGPDPDWRHLHAWSEMMRHTLTPSDVRALRQILDVHRQSIVPPEA